VKKVVVKKPEGYEKFRTVAELAQYVGVSTRTMERWHKDGVLPRPERVGPMGMKLWSPDQASAVLERRIARLPSTERSERRITR
jgi:predicted DNA-binding transcriptional regulator AlpA